MQEASGRGCEVVAIGGTADHVHLAVKLPNCLSDCEGFAWQEGYGVFSIGHNQLKPVADYVLNQKHHHAGGSTHARWEETDEEYILRRL